MRDSGNAFPEYREYTSQDYTGRPQRFRVKLSDLVSIGELNFFRVVEFCVDQDELGEKKWQQMPPAAIIDNGKEKSLAFHTRIDGGLGMTSVKYDKKLNLALHEAGVEVVNYSGLENKTEETMGVDLASIERHLQTAINKFHGNDRRGLALLVGSLHQPIRQNKDHLFFILDTPVLLSYHGFGPEDVGEVLRYVRYHQAKYGKDFSEALVRFLLQGLDGNQLRD